MIGEAWFEGQAGQSHEKKGLEVETPNVRSQPPHVRSRVWSHLSGVHRGKGSVVGESSTFLEGLCVWNVMLWRRKRALGCREKLNGGSLCRL